MVAHEEVKNTVLVPLVYKNYSKWLQVCVKVKGIVKSLLPQQLLFVLVVCVCMCVCVCVCVYVCPGVQIAAVCQLLPATDTFCSTSEDPLGTQWQRESGFTHCKWASYP